MSKISSTPEIETMYLKAIELCKKYELDHKNKQLVDALTEMYRLGAVYAIKSMQEQLHE